MEHERSAGAKRDGKSDAVKKARGGTDDAQDLWLWYGLESYDRY